MAAYSALTKTASVNVAIFPLNGAEDDKVDLKRKKLNISLIFFYGTFFELPAVISWSMDKCGLWAVASLHSQEFSSRRPHFPACFVSLFLGKRLVNLA